MAPDLLVALRGMHCIRATVRLARHPGVFGGIAIVGGPGAGKTFFSRLTREVARIERLPIAVPDRYITRAGRPDDMVNGEHAVDMETFDRMAAEGAFGLHWRRGLTTGANIGYGCSRPEPGHLPLYSCGSGIYVDPEEVRPSATLDGLLIVAIDAPATIRRQRMQERGDASILLDARAGFRRRDMVQAAHIVIANGMKGQDTVPDEWVHLLRAVTLTSR